MNERTEKAQAASGLRSTDAGTAGSAEMPSNAAPLPSLSLPKGGGAIRGVGEKFAANPVTGTATMTVPIFTSPGRSGFGPQLSLSYDSGSGNSPFGFGWTLALTAIARKTDKGLPQYEDAQESDIFILSGAEDLVPALTESAGQWVREVVPDRVVHGNQYAIQRYRPRVEGLFARIEHWMNRSDPRDTFWRTISKDNVTTWYGKTPESRVADPSDPSRIFSWLICESYDDKGNVISYQYKDEDSSGVDVTAANERNRTGLTRSARRYPKHVFYGNRTPYFPDLTKAAPVSLPDDWCFQVVFDYGEHDPQNPTPQDAGQWTSRLDPFSTYRSTFEVRTYRLCRRVLMFHHFAAETNVGLNCLVRSTDLVYSPPPADPTQPRYSYLGSVIQTGYRRADGSGYVSSSLPPLEFEYTEAVIDETVRDIDSASLENVPSGLSGTEYHWVDLDGEGLSGILTEQAGSWFYKPNLSPVNQQVVNSVEVTLPRFAPLEAVAHQPSLAALSGQKQQLLDLSGDGKLDLVEFDGPTPGYFERTDDADWEPFKAFRSLPVVDWRNPNLKLIDLTGDGFPDLFISENDAFWWHTSLAAEGFGPGHCVSQAVDEEKGPKLVFADGSESIFFADVSGDGLTDLVRIRNGEVCYWPNLGYGRFGAKVTMDRSPWFDRPDLFDGRRIRLADIDGSGTTDIIYLASGAVHLYFNQSGNGWGDRRTLSQFPAVENVSSTAAFDLLGNGTACLVWSSPLPGNARRPMRYIDLMGGQKPHLMTLVRNNLGAETVVKYAPSTKFYIADKLAGTPWVTRLPFPVHVVEQAQTRDYVSRNLFVARYAYHHGYFDGVEREFRGFGRVDQWDTEDFATLKDSADFPQPQNSNPAHSVPPVCTKTWFHTGAFFEEGRISRCFAHEYYSDPDFPSLEDTILPTAILLPDSSTSPYDLRPEEMREACRALRGSILRQEVYALDDSGLASLPYSVSERDYTIAMLQPRQVHAPDPLAQTRYGVFFVHARETIDFRYERKIYNPPALTRPATDPRVTHMATLAVDYFGNALQSASIGYGRRFPDANLTADDQRKQAMPLSTYVESTYTNGVLQDSDAHRNPLAAQSNTYELIQAAAGPKDATQRFGFGELETVIAQAGDGNHEILYENLQPTGLKAGESYRRLIGSTRIYYRPDDMGAAAGDPRALLPLGKLESLALPGAGYRLAFTKGLIQQVYQRQGAALLPAPAAVLASVAKDGGGYRDLDGNGNFWIPSGRIFHATVPATPQELNQARANFFLPRRFEDPFGNATTLDYETPHNLALLRTTDAAGNVIAAVNDYRVLRPALLTDPNGNQTALSFDTLGLVAARAVMGKTGENLGDSLTGVSADLSQPQIDVFSGAGDPHLLAAPLLGNATSRVVYDLNRFFRTRTAAPADPSQWLPAFTASLARETHVSDLAPGQHSKIQISFIYSDGFGREIQKKIQAEPGAVDNGPYRNPRWAAKGWTIFNNKGKPVRQYEPFFSPLSKGQQFEFGAAVGVSSILCYDPLERLVATIHPNQTYEKVVFDPWGQVVWDLNDTVAQDDPTADADVGNFFKRLPPADYSPTWRVTYAGGNAQQQDAAAKTAAHANTPTLSYLDTLGRTFLTIADNGAAGKYATRMGLDIQSNQRSLTDPLDRVAMVDDYGLLGQRIHQSSMEAGERWMLSDVNGKTIRAWDSRGHNFRTEFDGLRRQLNLFVAGSGGANPDPRTTAGEILFDKIVYGEGQPNDQALNLRTRIFQHFDVAGAAQNMVSDPAAKRNVAFDFKGNLLGASRRYVRDYSALPDWSLAAPPMLADVFIHTAQYDALNRVVAARTPDGSLTHPGYNEANFLESLDVNLLGASNATSFITNIDYNARGQRERIDYANQASTVDKYDPETFRLIGRVTARNADPDTFWNDPTQLTAAANAGKAVQFLSLTYDPTGNTTQIGDAAQQTIYFNNQRVEPSTAYTYDALYRLTRATGREQLGLAGGGSQPPWPSSYNDVPRVQLPHPGDGNAMGTYIEVYDYDNAGNLKTVKHTGGSPVNPGWTRLYTYAEPSLTEPPKSSNRLSSSSVSGSVVWNEPYTYDPHGNMTTMPQLQAMQWDFQDQLLMTRRQAVNSQDADGLQHAGERTYYVYNAAGERERKVTQSAAGVKIKERFYLGAVEVYREYDGAGNTTLERQTLRVMDDQRCVAMVETKTGGASATRFQFDNHLGTACLELDEAAAVITYEEYYPYGSTSYQAGRSAAETSLKRYRFTGKERDEETGLDYHGARYYAPWLGRWSSADPKGMVDGPNLYRYARDNPVVLTDPGGTDAGEEIIDPEKLALIAASLQRAIAATVGGGTAGAVGTGTAVGAGATGELGMGGAAGLGGGAAMAGGAVVAAQALAALAEALTVRLYMQRSANIARFGNPWGLTHDDFFPVIREIRKMKADPFPEPQPLPDPQPKPDPDKDKDKQPSPGRIYVTYTKYNKDTKRYYSGRTSAVIDLNKPWLPQAIAAMRARDSNHHVDERDEPQAGGFESADLDKYAVGRAVNYEERYRDVGYLAIRGREQQLIDSWGKKKADELGIKDFSGGAQSDTGTGTPLTENKERGVSKDLPAGEVFHEASNFKFGPLAPFTGRRVLRGLGAGAGR